MNNPPNHGRTKGFALVTTLALMILLVVVAVGLLSLATISLRATSQENERANARANARLGLMLAIAQLQKNLGPDQRISAPANVSGVTVPASHENWTGAWKSDASSPSSFPAGRKDRFATWLVSQAPSATLDSVTSQSGASMVMERLSDGRETRAPLLGVDGGNLAWWTADEAQKATVDLADIVAGTDSEQIANRHQSPRLSPETIKSIGTFPKDAATVARLITPGQIRLAGVPVVPGQNRSLTVGARSVLADVQLGGLKRDFSSLLEMPEADISGYGKWSGANSINDPSSYIYGPQAVAFGARWNQLHSYYNLYKDVTVVNNEPRIQLSSQPLIDWNLADKQTDFGDKLGGFRYPRISRILYVFSYSAVPPSGTETQYKLRLGVDPYLLLWNPFDVRISFPANRAYFAKFSNALPFKFTWFVNGGPRGSATSLADIIPTGGDGLFLKSQFKMLGSATFNMAPGETRLFSLGTTKSSFTGTDFPDFVPGLYFNDLLYYDNVLGSAGMLKGGPDDRISVRMEPYNQSTAIYGKSQYLDFWIYDRIKGSPYMEHRGEVVAEGNTQFTQQLDSLSENSLPSVTMKDASVKKKPFAAFIMEMKSAADSKVATPSFLFSGAARLSSRLSTNSTDFALDRLEYKLEKMESFQSTVLQCTLPGDPNGENHGYIGSGRLPFNGRTHMIALGIPSMPPVSLGNFRHASVGDGASTLRATLWAAPSVSSTQSPTYTDQAVGNSYAHPRIPAEATTATDSGATLLDHSYLANDALWDGWFFSSLASRSRDGTAIEPKDMWNDFVAAKKPLLNPRMRLWKGPDSDSKLLTDVFDNSKIRLDAHKNIASHLLLDGGFNVNSTSVDAWTAFLSSTRHRSIRKLNRTGSAGGSLLEAKGTLFSRGDFVLDDPVDNAGSGDSQYSGFRDLTDDQIRTLASKVVEQVKKRGPFLTLAQFVNRRPDTNKDLSLSGALQAAIDETDLNDKLKALGRPGVSPPPNGSFSNVDAARLNTSTGAPGWLMQGDILDPLGPFITVRGDTFRIRSYGQATDKQGKVLAKAWCEAVVQRTPEYIDKTESAQTRQPVSPANLGFGREFRMISFRWLNNPDI